MPAEHSQHPGYFRKTTGRARRDELTAAPLPEYREMATSRDGPRTSEEFRAAIEEMRANDHEYREWESAERLGDLLRGRLG